MIQYPKISVVTPSYNAMPFLEETIKSILNQQYPDLEHLVMDGGSSDNTRQVLESYPHLIWVSEKDRGQSHALNKGFSRVSGEIIGWLNADDTYEPGTLHAVAAFFAANPDIDFIGTDINIIDESSRKIGFSKGKPFNLDEFLIVNTIKQPCVFMRRHMVDKLVGVDENLHYVMDHEYWLRAYLAGFKFMYIPDQVFANFRMISGTKSFENAPEFYREWAETVRKYFNTPELATYADQESVIREIESQYFIALTIKNINEKQPKAAFKNLIFAIQKRRKLLFNRGIYKFLFLMISGRQRSLTAKYKK